MLVIEHDHRTVTFFPLVWVQCWALKTRFMRVKFEFCGYTFCDQPFLAWKSDDSFCFVSYTGLKFDIAPENGPHHAFAAWNFCVRVRSIWTLVVGASSYFPSSSITARTCFRGYFVWGNTILILIKMPKISWQTWVQIYFFNLGLSGCYVWV